MGVDVVLMRVTRQGTSSRVNPYGDLILSPAEMEQFITEAGALIAGSDEVGADRIRRVLELARQCRDEPGTELRLQGD